MSRNAEQTSQGTQTLTIAKGLNLGLRAAMEADNKVILLGEDIGRLGGVFRITDSLQKDFGEERVLDTPLSESGIIGAAIGLAVRGYRPVCEIQFDGFIFPGFDQIISQLAKLHYRSEGRIPVPVVVRVPYGGGIGAVEHHSESPESLFCHIAGLKVVSCSNATDAYWMMQQAIASDDPVLFFEPKRRYWEKADVDMTAEPAPLMASRLVRRGDQDTANRATLVSYGPQMRTCLDAATAAAEDGVSLDVIDLRSLSPLNLEPVFESVRRTGRLVMVTEAPSESSISSEVAARVQQECFYSLEAPVHRVTGFDTPYPPAKLEEYYLPDLDRVLYAVDQTLAY
ncbi:alpha-ketoacid dehydrogenase subunit beta [Haloechinothrix sp. YIM 98757]|uniref:Alpha-ketoacid dehydrogenase subunit beta n=1 Tax=Haloechinothrix aidingensis TaxID=2752311 RepID=A0A838A6G1_9PSEU|nr:alpha-ketoacid dehydrogenase subunit beta [Haloechinothrix aidingensis]MBA0123947.1 alpha-ketoacid dehydrogenase subunit beta [Haloechinothrix aidingensis]